MLYRLRPTARSTVALIVAPAGYGKTTILRELVRRRGRRPFAWIGVDREDNDPARLVRCVAAALERAGAVDGTVLGSPARSRSPDSHAVLLARLLRGLKRARPFAIAIDDLQRLTSPRSLKVVEALAGNLPARSQLLLASRTHPRLRLTKVRAEGRLIELGTEDLRLTDQEAIQLLRSAGVEATPEETAELAARAEGWPAGLFLATLAAADGVQLGYFDGSDRFVADLFAAEYLDALDADDRTFLDRVSVLGQLSGPFCDAVLEASDSNARLERIARANLFVQGIGAGKPRAFRLHPMLRDALVAELRRNEPGQAEAIATRASEESLWHGDQELAAEYAWESGDRELFAALAEQWLLPTFQHGAGDLTEQWLERMSDDLLRRHPALAVAGAYLHAVQGRPDSADAWAAFAESCPPDTPMPDGTPSAEPWLAALRAARCPTGQGGMRADAADALTGLEEGSPWWPIALFLLGAGQVLAGESAAADEILAEAHIAATITDSPDTAALALAERSLLAAAEERWEAAEALADAAREIVRHARLEHHPTSPLTFVAGARAAVHHSDWVRARNDLQHALACLPPLAPEWFAAHVHLETAQTLLELSEREEAGIALAHAERILERGPDLGVLGPLAAALREELDRTTRPNGSAVPLTAAELRLLPLLTTHLTFREIGELLHISRNTVKTQAISAYRKLGVTSRSEAIGRAIDLGLVEKPEALDVG